MINSQSRVIPVILVFVASLLVLSFGCINIPGLTGTANDTLTTVPSDPFGPQLESLNNEISLASSDSQISSLNAKVTLLESQILTNGSYPDYLLLTQAQSRTLAVLNASLIFSKEKSAFAKSGVDCSKDYSSILIYLKGVNYTKQVGITKVNTYLAKNSKSNSAILITTMNKVDTESMYLFSVLLPEEKSYICPQAKKPAKTYVLPLTQSEAAKLAVDELVGSEKYFVYSIGKALEAGTNVSVQNPDGNITSRILKSKSWFFMLDKTPSASFSHDVKFIFIDLTTSEYFVTNEVSNPIINGINYWSSLDSRLNPAWIVYPAKPVFDLNQTLSQIRSRPTGSLFLAGTGSIASVPAGTSCDKLDCCKGVGKDIGLVVNGDDQTLFDTDTANMYEYLKKSGIAAGDITYLTAKAGVPESDGVTSPKTFKEAIEKIAKEAKCCDRMFMYITGHGTNVTFYIFKNLSSGKNVLFNREEALAADAAKYNYTGYAQKHHTIHMNPPSKEAMADGTVVDHGSPEGGRMWADEIGALLDSIKSCDVTVMYDSCHSGFAGVWLEGKGRTIMTTSDQGSSYAYPSVGGKSYGGIWNTLWLMAHDTFKHEADKNGDGKVDNKEAYDYANKYTPEVVKAHTGKDQAGTIKESTSPCVCCHVPCNITTSYQCVVVEGEGTNDPRCKKVGDYCQTVTTGGNTTTGIQNNVTENVTGNGTTTTGGTGTTAGVCGDNIKSANEECESDKDCPKYRYCDKKTCACKQYPLICGDGHISAAEACDHKASPTGCSEGKVCDLQCRCVEAPAVCGDGRVGTGEQCDSGVPCTQSGMTCNLANCQCVAYTTTGGTTGGTNTTPQIPGGSGQNTTPTPYCGDGTVNGNEQCESSGQCSSGYSCSSCHCVANPTYCGDKIVNGNEQCDGSNNPCGGYGVCSAGCTCVNPPSLNCDQICGYTAGASAFQGTFTSSQQCGDYVKNYYGTKTCFSTCTYSYLYTVTNIAGSASCCCGMKKEFPCSDCPGQNPVCPSTSTCTANAPSWYSPQ